MNLVIIDLIKMIYGFVILKDVSNDISIQLKS